MAITVTPNRIGMSNTGYALTAATGVSQVAGTSEDFEFVFPCKDETAYIIIANGAIAAVTAKLKAAPNHGSYTPNILTLATGKIAAFRLETGFVKDAGGKVTLTVNPGAAQTVSGLGVKIYGVYNSVASR